MGADEKMAHAAEKAKGKAKEAAGRAVGNETLHAEGRVDKVKGDAKQTAEKAKDTLKD
jgi:uncharacterized protein YjbJ (UPF0337 family)